MTALNLSSQDLLEVTLAKISAFMAQVAPGPGPMTFVAKGVNLNVAAGDTAIPIALPTSFSRYMVQSVTVAHASTSLTTATAGIFTAVSGGGATIAAAAALAGITATAEDTNANALQLTLTDATTRTYIDQTLYVHVGTAQGAAATADVSITILPIS